MFGSTENLIVGAPYEIYCKVHTKPEVHAEIVNITWIGLPNIDTDNRISVIPLTSDGSNHTSILQFLYLSDKDEGLYGCNVTIFNRTDSMYFELEGILSKLMKCVFTA